MYADENVIKIKHAVLLEVAKAAFAGNLDEIRDDIPFTLIPGPTPQFRCCIYKEREIIRQRVRLAEGKAPSANDDGNIYQHQLHFSSAKLHDRSIPLLFQRSFSPLFSIAGFIPID